MTYTLNLSADFASNMLKQRAATIIIIFFHSLLRGRRVTGVNLISFGSIHGIQKQTVLVKTLPSVCLGIERVPAARLLTGGSVGLWCLILFWVEVRN